MLFLMFWLFSFLLFQEVWVSVICDLGIILYDIIPRHEHKQDSHSYVLLLAVYTEVAKILPKTYAETEKPWASFSEVDEFFSKGREIPGRRGCISSRRDTLSGSCGLFSVRTAELPFF